LLRFLHDPLLKSTTSLPNTDCDFHACVIEAIVFGCVAVLAGVAWRRSSRSHIEFASSRACN
jgi:hypothetical protein